MSHYQISKMTHPCHDKSHHLNRQRKHKRQNLSDSQGQKTADTNSPEHGLRHLHSMPQTRMERPRPARMAAEAHSHQLSFCSQGHIKATAGQDHPPPGPLLTQLQPSSGSLLETCRTRAPPQAAAASDRDPALFHNSMEFTLKGSPAWRATPEQHPGGHSPNPSRRASAGTSLSARHSCR